MIPPSFQTSRHAVYALPAHLVLTPKYRRAVMSPRVTTLLRQGFAEVCHARRATLIACETDRDHVHLLVRYPPTVALSSLVMTLKSVTAQQVRGQDWSEVRQPLWGAHCWSPSYCVVSVGGASLETVKRYVENQQAPDRHRRAPRKRP